MKKFTTSAQKTLLQEPAIIFKKLEEAMVKDTGLEFKETKRKNIKEARLEDGSKLVIATFDKGNGKAIAMIDHKEVPGTLLRSEVQKSLRLKLDKIFV